MGLFSKRKTFVSSTAVPLLDIQSEPIKESVIRSLIRRENISDNLIDDAVNSISNNMARVYQYGRDEYAYGLPGGSTGVMMPDNSAIQTYLDGVESDPVTLTKVELERAHYEFFLQDYLVSNHNYNRLTGRVNTPAASEVLFDSTKTNYIANLEANLETTLDGLRGDVPSDSHTQTSTTHAGKAATRHTVVTHTVTNFIKTIPVDVRYALYLGSDLNALESDSPQFFNSYRSEMNLKVHAKASLFYTPNTAVYYTYLDGSDDSPTVNTVGSTIELIGVDQSYETSETDTFNDVFVPSFNRRSLFYYIEYHTTESDGTVTPKHLLYEEGANGFPEFPGDIATDSSPYYPFVTMRLDNEDQFDISRQGNPAYETGIKLLKKTNLDALDLASVINENPDIDDIDHAFLMFGVGLNTESDASIRYLVDFFEHMHFQQTQVQADLPDYSDLTDLDVSRSTDDGPAPIRNVRISGVGLDMRIDWTKSYVRFIQGSIGPVGTVSKDIEIGNSELLTLRHQFDNDTYKEIVVFNLKHTNYVYENHTVETTLEDLVNEPDDNNFIIPLHHGVVEDLPIFVKHQLFYDAPQLVFYSYETIKLKWYQTTIFKVILTVIAIVVFIYTGIDVYTTFMALLATSGITAATIFILQTILTAIVINYAFKYTVKVLGDRFAFVVAVLAVVASIYGINAGVATNTNSWADRLLELSINLTDAIASNIEDDIIELQKEFDVFQDEASDLMDELEQQQELLSTSKLLNPFEFIRQEPLINLNESPSNFYQRTIHSGNVGPLSYESISRYVDINLRLPDPIHT